MSAWWGRCQRCSRNADLAYVDVPGGRVKVCLDCYELWRIWKGLA